MMTTTGKPVCSFCEDCGAFDGYYEAGIEPETDCFGWCEPNEDEPHYAPTTVDWHMNRGQAMELTPTDCAWDNYETLPF